jgi:predicted nucleic acid-binding protein
MEKILMDSDVLIDFLRGYDKRIRDVFRQLYKKQIVGILSTINIVELYSGKDVLNYKKLASLKKLLSYFQILSLKQAVAELAGTLRFKYSLGLADSVIAATCIKEKAKLFTFNTKDFKKIKELTLLA